MTSDTNIIDGPDILPLEEVMATYNANNGVQIANDSPDQELLMATGQEEVLREGQGNETAQNEKGAMQNLLVEGDSEQNKKRSQETEEKDSKKRGAISTEKSKSILKKHKTANHYSCRVRPNNRSVFRLCELITPVEKRLYCQLQETREQNARLKKKASRYFKLLQYYGLATEKKVKKVEGFKILSNLANQNINE